MKNSYFKYFASLLLFGTNGIVASFIALSSYEIVLLRASIGSLLLVGIFLLMKGRLTFWQHKRQSVFLFISGVAMGANWMFLYEAYRHIGVSIASLLYYCGPVIVMILSPLLFHEKLTATKVFGFLAVFCGIFLVNGQAVQAGKSGWGLFCGAMSGILYALLVISNKKAESITGLENPMLQLVTSFLTVAVFVLAKQGFHMQIAGSDWLPILVLGLLNTGVGCYLYFSSIGKLPVQTVAICGYLEPLSAVVFSMVILNETMLPLQIVGAVLIIGGAVFGECAGNMKLFKYYEKT